MGFEQHIQQFSELVSSGHYALQFIFKIKFSHVFLTVSAFASSLGDFCIFLEHIQMIY